MVQFDVLANDTDIDSLYVVQTFSIDSFTQPLSGSVIQNGNFLEYTPTGSFSGADIFQYRLIDQSGALSTNTGTVTVNVTLPNMPPDAYDLNLPVNEDAILNDVLSGSDINGDILSYTAVTLPTNGVLDLQSNGSFTYTPNANYNGTDTFTYTVFDGQLSSNTATFTAFINSVPDAPIGIDDSYSLNQDTTLLVPVMNNDSDADSISLMLTGVSTPAHGTAVITGTGIQYTPTP